MTLGNYSTSDLVDELERRRFKKIFVSPYDTYKLDIVPQPCSVGDYIEGEGPVVILIIED